MNMLVGLGLGLTYVVCSLWLGEWFPFSRYSMYSEAGNRTEGAIPVLFLNGEPTSLAAYRNFSGLDPNRIIPDGHQCSMERRVFEAQRWVREHLRTESPPDHAVEVAWGFVIVRIDADGRLNQRQVVLTRGRAW